jgi:hypothetical protein
MLYLLDANVLMTAHSTYYPIDAVPEFWHWLTHQADAGMLKMPLETFEEVKDGSRDEERDLLYAWVRTATVRRALVLPGEVRPDLVQQVIEQGYADDLTDDELIQIGKDPFLIAHALEHPARRCVVTTEVSKPSKQRQNRRVPDVCRSVGVQCFDTFAMLRALRFSTAWRDTSG